MYHHHHHHYYHLLSDSSSPIIVGCSPHQMQGVGLGLLSQGGRVRRLRDNWLRGHKTCLRVITETPGGLCSYPQPVLDTRHQVRAEMLQLLATKHQHPATAIIQLQVVEGDRDPAIILGHIPHDLEAVRPHLALSLGPGRGRGSAWSGGVAHLGILCS